MRADVSADYLIVGSGIAGLRAAVELQRFGTVLILTKADPRAGSTGYAQGGIAAAVGSDDRADLHYDDTIAAGDGLCDAAAVRVLVEEGPQYVRELLEWGAAFDRRADGELDLAQEGAHSVRRVLHAHDATGREISRILAARLAGPPQVTVMPHALAVQAFEANGRVAGVRFLDAEGSYREARARATLLATGGAGRVFGETTNPPVATGDGVALAYLAGARVMDLEFVQFHPTALAIPNLPRYLLSEALRGEGARLVNDAGEPFMLREDPRGDLAPRDRVARAIVRESARTGAPVYLSLAHLSAPAVRERFPEISEFCARAGLDLATDRIPVGPAAHYLMGGVATDVHGCTSVPGLYAAGEVACTGVHGANRLASNSLLEGLVFGGRAARAMQQDREAAHDRTPVRTDPLPGDVAATAASAPDIGELMWRHVGVFRTADGLADAVRTLDEAWHSMSADIAAGRSVSADGWVTRSMTLVARLIARAALRRTESRGGHWRQDFPERDDLHWRRHASDVRE